MRQLSLSLCVLFIMVNTLTYAAKALTAEQKRALQEVYVTQQNNVMCSSGAGDIRGCSLFSSKLSDAVNQADEAGVPREQIITTELQAISDGLKVTQPQSVIPGIAQ